MPGTVTEVYRRYGTHPTRIAKMIMAHMAIVADTDDASVPATALSAMLMKRIRGYFLAEMTIFAGSPAPSNGFDVTLIGADTGLDLLGGAAENINPATPNVVLPLIGSTAIKRPVIEDLTFTVSGNTTESAVCDFYLIFVRDY